MERKNLNDYLSKTNLQLLTDFKWGVQGQNDFGQFMNLVRKQPYIDETTYDKVHMAYCIMKDLLIEMNNFGDLESYDTEDIFKLIGELEQDS